MTFLTQDDVLGTLPGPYVYYASIVPYCGRKRKRYVHTLTNKIHSFPVIFLIVHFNVENDIAFDGKKRLNANGSISIDNSANDLFRIESAKICCWPEFKIGQVSKNYYLFFSADLALPGTNTSIESNKKKKKKQKKRNILSTLM